MPSNKDFAIRIEILDECFRNSLKKWTLKALMEAVNDKLNDRIRPANPSFLIFEL